MFRVWHNRANTRWVVETTRWAAAGKTRTEALWHLAQCYWSWLPREQSRGRLHVLAIDWEGRSNHE